MECTMLITARTMKTPVGVSLTASTGISTQDPRHQRGPISLGLRLINCANMGLEVAEVLAIFIPLNLDGTVRLRHGRMFALPLVVNERHTPTSHANLAGPATSHNQPNYISYPARSHLGSSPKCCPFWKPSFSVLATEPVAYFHGSESADGLLSRPTSGRNLSK